MANVIVMLNAKWHVADDPPQWTLQQRIGNGTDKDSGWRGRKFIRDRDHLLRCIDELCGEIDPGVMEIINSWPDGYVTWKLREMQVSAGPGTGPHSAISDPKAMTC